MHTRQLNPVFLSAIVLLCLPSFLWGQPASPVSSEDKNSQAQFEQAVEAARKNIDSLEMDLDAEKRLHKEDSNQQQIYRTQINSLRNFLFVPDISISVIEKGVEEVDISLSLVKSKIQRTTEKKNKTSQNIATVKDKINLIDLRIQEYTSFKDKAVTGDPGLKDFKSYRSLLEKQLTLFQSISDLLTLGIKTHSDLLKALEDIQAILRKEIKDKKGKLLFQKDDIEIKAIWSRDVINEMIHSLSKTRQLFTRDWLSLKWSLIKEYLNLRAVMVISGFVVLSFFVFQALSLMRSKQSVLDILTKRAGYPLIILEKSQFLIFWILLAAILSKTQIYFIFPDFINFFKTFLMVFLMTKIVSESIRLVVGEKDGVFFSALYDWKNLCVWGIRLYALVYLLAYRFFAFDAIVLAFIRIISEIVFVAAVFSFWKSYGKIENQAAGMGIKLLHVWSKAVVISGLFMDISGYSHFASWWYISWGVSVVVISVCVMLVYSIKEIDGKFREKIDPESQKFYGISSPVYWVLSKSLYFLIIVFALTGLAFSWSSSDAFFVYLWEIFNKKYAIGNIELSMVSFAYSILVLFLTYLFIQLWEKVIARHVLKESGLSTGAKGSVITISTYAIWSAGILVSLSVFGLNTTSLAVVFGALSIGLGFGLQNIFNNFVSGLILLFERPIQVGDVVEVGGIWGEVKKINVRATLVQTYTNSSLIIPNSEFISALVTNWSHKDPFIRRDLLVGVAYGSDTERVKTLLLKAADAVKGIYDAPQKPRVQFINFGDSSLDFRLRFWSDIDNFVEAESNLRYEIDRLFRAHDVVIPFPQRDLHIMTSPAGIIQP